MGKIKDAQLAEAGAIVIKTLQSLQLALVSFTPVSVQLIKVSTKHAVLFRRIHLVHVSSYSLLK